MDGHLTSITVEGHPIRLRDQWIIEHSGAHLHAEHTVSISYRSGPAPNDVEAVRSKLPYLNFTHIFAACKGRTLTGQITNAICTPPRCQIVHQDDFALLGWEQEAVLIAVLDEFKSSGNATFICFSDLNVWLLKHFYTSLAQSIARKMNREVLGLKGDCHVTR